MAKKIIDFIGREGATLSPFRSNIDPSKQNNPLVSDENEILRQLSVAKEIEVQRGLTQEEAERMAELQAALDFKRNQAGNLQSNALKELFPELTGGVASGGTPAVGNGFDYAGLEGDIRSGSDAQRKALEDIFSSGRTRGETALNESFAGERGRAIDEASAAGLSRMPGFLTKTLADIDARKSNALRDLSLGLEGQRATGRLGVEEAILGRLQRGKEFGANLGQQESQFGRQLSQSGRLALAGIGQSGQQFGQSFGLEKEKFGEAKRRSSIEDMFTNRALDEAERAGRAEANASKPTFLDQFAQVTGGIGSLTSGIGSLNRPKRQTAGVY